MSPPTVYCGDAGMPVRLRTSPAVSSLQFAVCSLQVLVAMSPPTVYCGAAGVSPAVFTSPAAFTSPVYCVPSPNPQSLQKLCALCGLRVSIVSLHTPSRLPLFPRGSPQREREVSAFQVFPLSLVRPPSLPFASPLSPSLVPARSNRHQADGFHPSPRCQRHVPPTSSKNPGYG